MAWDEWEHVKANAAAQQSTPMRLNQLAPTAGGGGAGKPDLASSPAAKKAAAKAIDDDLEPGVTRDGKHAAETTNAAVKAFAAKDGHGWDTSGALKRAHETWEKQVKMLLGRLSSEKQALSATGISMQNNELDIAARLARQSRIQGI
ncbi:MULTISPECIES: hypothetical protein [unclassified Streptomyces]|uniref:hypothetical protein n=1 Tax=unclassified Streptomyces TaxID=2593676 RepID=UPI000701D980|nr:MULTISPECIES: hypothetical protein [unclassified Streptomyces]KQX51517.1 hypothetical protein ASD33_33525 [Streptomyces sp. Root1304]KRA85936.1 hypothetical protein ASE09_33505 [Streptomyces sp. Root66D1]